MLQHKNFTSIGSYGVANHIPTDYLILATAAALFQGYYTLFLNL